MTYYIKQLKAAYILPRVQAYLDGCMAEEQAIVDSLYSYDANFELVTNFKVGERGDNSYERLICLVAGNIVQRGLPTLAPELVQKYAWNDEVLSVCDIKRSLVICDDNYEFRRDKRYYQKTPQGILAIAEINNTECDFLLQQKSFYAQHIELQKPLETIIECPNTDIQNYSSYARFGMDLGKQDLLRLFNGQRLDMAIELPEINPRARHCVAVELDGVQHEGFEQAEKDKYRDYLLRELLWDDTVRVTDIRQAMQYEAKLRRVFADYQAIYDASSNILDSIRYPLYIARVTRAVLYLVEHNSLPIFSKDCVVILADELDEIIALGIQNALDMLYHINNMGARNKTTVAEVYLKGKNKTYRLIPGAEEIYEIEDYVIGLFASLSIKARPEQRLFAFNDDGDRVRTVYLYSSYGEDETFGLGIADKAITYRVTETQKPDLTYFLRNIFGKPSFRPKQFEIIKTALNRNNVIGLLPTGSGKTLTYQLPAMLQPQLTIVIAPLVSLMSDQLSNLYKHRIDICDAVNGSLSSMDKRLVLKKLDEKKYLLFYIAPERLQIKEFKDKLCTLRTAQVVLDEAHCVSQWGHDFRPAYLRVGKTIQSLMKDVVIMALTGTASCNVITDIKRELNMRQNVNIITPTDFKRPELHFEVVALQDNYSLDDKIKKGAILDNLQYVISEYEKLYLQATGTSFFEQHDGNYVNAGIIFCPFAKKKNSSVNTVYEALRGNKSGCRIGKYHGQMSNVEKMRAQTDFTAGKTAVLIATKAFGMGIDKPNIRFTLHTCIPESIEAFYQEAGRAGRDGHDALNIILAPPTRIDYENVADRMIYDYFLKLSFPERDNFKKQIREFLQLEQIYARGLPDLFECLPEIEMANVSFKLDRNDKAIVELKPDKKKLEYAIETGVGQTVDLVPARDVEVEDKNPLFDLYRERIRSSISKVIQLNENFKIENLTKLIDLKILRKRESLLTLLAKCNSDKPHECIIGLNADILTNKIERFMSFLIRKTGKDFQISQAEYKKLTYYRDEYNRHCRDSKEQKKKFDVSPFLAFCNTILIRHKEEALAEQYWQEAETETSNVQKATIGHLQDKILYYLGVLDVYTDFERHYSPDYVKIVLQPISKDKMKQSIIRYISGYETADYVKRKVKNFSWLDTLADDDTDEILIKSLEFIIDYSYDKIKEYRKKQTEVMYRCIQQHNPSNRQAFIGEIYKYFESKYAAELLGDVKQENLKLIDKWIKKVEEDADSGAANIKENLSHLRVSALKVQEERPQAFTPYFLYAYSILLDTDLDIRTGIAAYLEGMKLLKGLRSNYRAYVNRFCRHIFKSDDAVYLQEVSKIIDREFKYNRDINEMKTVVQELLNTVSQQAAEQPATDADNDLSIGMDFVLA